MRLFQIFDCSSSTSPKANTALRTHSGQGHSTVPVSTPFRSLQMVAPHFSLNVCQVYKDKFFDAKNNLFFYRLQCRRECRPNNEISFGISENTKTP